MLKNKQAAMDQLSIFFKSETFKKISFTLAVIFFLLSFLTVFKPGPFLKFGYPGIFVAHLLGAGAVLTVGIAKYFNPYLLALVTALGMALNDSVSYIIGKNSDLLIKRSPKVIRIEDTIHRFGPYALFAWSLIPFPYDIIGIIAGYLEFPFLKFFLPTLAGKFIRTFFIALGIISLTT